MLKTMRDSFHHLKWTLYAVILVFILGFVYFVGSGAGSRDPGSQVIARVGDETISAVDFSRRYQAELDRQRGLYQGNLSPELLRAMDLPRQVLENMIDRILELEAARRLHLKVTDEEVAQAIVNISAFQDNGQFIGREKYERLLRSNGSTPERFEEEFRESLLLEKYSQLVRSSLLVPDAEVRREFASRNDKASIEYLRIPTGRLSNPTPPGDPDLKTYFERHRERYRAPEQRRIKYLLVDRSRIRAKIMIPETELRTEYERRTDSFRAPEQVNASHILIQIDPSKGETADADAKARAERILARARKAEDFAKLANENTEDPSGKGNGGQLPPFSRGQMAPEFDQAAFDMSPGEIRGPIKTRFGYHVIKLNFKIAAHVRPFEEVRAQLSSELTERRAEAETDRRARELAEKIRHIPNTSDEQLRKLQDDAVTYNTTEWVSRGAPIPGIGANARFSDAAWSSKLGQLDRNPVTTLRGPAFVKPAEQRPAGPPPFEEIRSRALEDLQAERRQKEASDALTPAVRELASGATMASLAARYETDVKTTPDFSPGGPVPEIGVAPELSAAVFATGKGQVGPPVPVPGGFVLFRVLSRTMGDPAAFEAQKADLSDGLRSREADRLLRSALGRLRGNQGVEINEDLLKSFLPEATGPRRG
ncbi:MAG: peptidylprolyl isomerase [Thermoanaerobaculia bacterium]